MPASRPRSSSGIVEFHIVLRNRPLTMSAATAAASRASAGARERTAPKPRIATPHSPAATRIARPCRETCDVQPDVSVASSEPTEGAA